LVCFVGRVSLVESLMGIYFDQPNKRDKPNKPDRQEIPRLTNDK